MRINALFYLLLMGFSDALYAVTHPNDRFRIMASQRLSVEDGLAHEAVLALTRDKDGIVWFGTNGGIQSFDGLHFSTIRSFAGEKNTLPGNGTFALYKGTGDYLWAGIRNGGLVRINIHTNDILRATDKGYSQNEAGKYYVLSICEDSAQNIWAATSKGLLVTPVDTGIARFIPFPPELAVSRIHKVLCDNNRVLFLSDNLLVAVDRSSEKVINSIRLPIGSGNNINDFALAKDSQGTLYAGSTKGVTTIDKALNSARMLWPKPNQPEQLVRAIIPRDNNQIWLGTGSQGAVLIDSTTGNTLNQLTHNSDYSQQGIHNTNIYDLLLDDAGILWIAGSGVEWVALDTPGITSYANKHKDNQTLLENSIISSHIDANEVLWQLSLPTGISYLAKGSDSFVSLSAQFKQLWQQQYPSQSPYLTVLQPADNGNFWLSANKGFIYWNRNNDTLRYYNRLNTDNQQPDKRSLDIIRDKHGIFWFTQYGGVLYYQATTDSFVKIALPDGRDDKVVEFIEYKEDILVLSTHKLYRLNINDFKLQELSVNDNQKSTLSSQFVAMRHANNTLWIAGDGGLTKAEITADNTVSYHDVSTRSIVDNTFHSLEIDSQDNVWLSSSKGIYKYAHNKQQFAHYGVGHGVTISDFYDRSSFITADGQLYFGGVGGWVVINPAKIPQHVDAPLLKLWRVQVSDEQHKPARQQSSIIMEMAQHRLQLYFSAIDYHAPRKNQYAFLLQGDDNQWHYAGSNPTVTYTGLSPGNYVLHAKAATPHSNWSTQNLQLPITVLPPWYRSTIAFVCYGLSVMLLLMAFAWRRYQLSQERKRYLAKIERSEQQMKLAIWGSGDSIWDWHLNESRIERLGLAFLGYQDEEIPNTKQGYQALLHPQDLAQFIHDTKLLLTGQSQKMTIEYRIKHKAGHWCWVADRGKVVDTIEGKPTRLSGTLKDINQLKVQERALQDLNTNLELKVEQRTIALTDKNTQLTSAIDTLKTTQVQLVEAEKMASLGKVVAGLAHEMNTPLGVTTTAASCLDIDIQKINDMLTQATLTKNNLVRSISSISDSTGLIVKNVARTANLVNTFKQLSIEIEQTNVIALPNFVEQVKQTFQSKDNQPAFSVTINCSDTFQTQSIPEYLHLILSKLFDNSLSHGFNSIECAQIEITVLNTPSKWTLKYADNGSGIDEVTAQEIFEPFFTTKRNQGFTGLGMHIVYNLVTQGLNGTIHCENSPQGGLVTTMTFDL